ncbi:MAG: hypothetical protein QM648_08355 [Solirubrobacterales bacterium]
MNPATAVKTPAAARAKRAKAAPKVSCADCFFHQNQLCALGEEKPCPTFRPAAENLRPPQQLAFVFRQERTRSAWVFQQPS